MSNSRLQEWQGSALLIIAAHACHSVAMSRAFSNAARSGCRGSAWADVRPASRINGASPEAGQASVQLQGRCGVFTVATPVSMCSSAPGSGQVPAGPGHGGAVVGCGVGNIRVFPDSRGQLLCSNGGCCDITRTRTGSDEA